MADPAFFFRADSLKQRRDRAVCRQEWTADTLVTIRKDGLKGEPHRYVRGLTPPGGTAEEYMPYTADLVRRFERQPAAKRAVAQHAPRPAAASQDPLGPLDKAGHGSSCKVIAQVLQGGFEPHPGQRQSVVREWLHKLNLHSLDSRR